MKEPIYEVRTLPDGTIQMDEGGVRCFLVPGSKKALLIDTGYGTGDLKALCDSLTDLPVTLVNTHADGDHTGCNVQFSEAYLQEGDWPRARRSLPEGYPLLPVREGDIFDLGGRKLEALHIPGHTPGSIALLDRENRILFGGDTVQEGPIYMFGEGRSMEQFRDSIQRLLTMRDLFDTIYPSHHGIPLNPGILVSLLAGAEKALKGELQSKPVELHGQTVLLSADDDVSFYLPE